ncbi:MAG: ribulokinase [Armatimonadetes bacterium 55-13]|nr:ribulokinase [Armatimonadota bacterium]ODU52274.1 MAG: ribulokinase [bacterium SCN 57-13]OJU65414.1 MAG: ribulokinase [Armatimonadetes bacterium 55-13]
MKQYSIGFDYGTNSVRALLVDCADGREVATSVFNYPSGEQGVILDPKDPNLARQHPGDYFAGATATIREVLAEAAKTESGFSVDQIVGIGVDTTGSSPLPLRADGLPLGMDPAYCENPHAQCWLWKDHTSYAEAAEITEKAQGYPYLSKIGGTYSSEWFWSKILRCARVAPDVFEAAHSWCELQDLIPAWLTGNINPRTMSRGVCAAGHKGMYSAQWGGLPSEEFLETLDPRLAALRGRLYDHAETADQPAGRLSAERAASLGLPESVVVSVGAMDAHLGAVGSSVKPGTLVKIMGTSTCDIMVGDSSTPDIPGVCGIVDGSVIPGMLGIEAGQSAVGDLFNWCASKLAPGSSHEELTREALKLKPGESGLLALDWNNGNRTILVDPRLTGLLVGQTLYTTAAEIYRTLIEATAYGALTIIRRIEEYGVKIDEIVCCGGIAEKSALAMQIYADVCNRPIKISRSAQTCALGSAIMASVAGGAHGSVLEAIHAMAGVKEIVYTPNPSAVSVYARLFALYGDLHDSFGKVNRQPDLHGLMKELLDIRDEALSA